MKFTLNEFLVENKTMQAVSRILEQLVLGSNAVHKWRPVCIKNSRSSYSAWLDSGVPSINITEVLDISTFHICRSALCKFR